MSALLLGGLGLNTLNHLTGMMNIGNFAPGLIAGPGLMLALFLSLSERDQAHQTARLLRLGLITLGMVGALGMIFSPDLLESWIAIPIFMICLLEEGIGRWLFYEALHQRNL
jgi:hypothetical protein